MSYAEYCYHIWAGGAKCYLTTIVCVERRVKKINYWWRQPPPSSCAAPRNWNSLPASVFPSNYNQDAIKTRVNILLLRQRVCRLSLHLNFPIREMKSSTVLSELKENQNNKILQTNISDVSQKRKDLLDLEKILLLTALKTSLPSAVYEFWTDTSTKNTGNMVCSIPK